MSARFDEPEVLWTGGERTWQGSKTRLQLERGAWQGHATFALRLTWLAPDGVWRWSAAQPSRSSGKAWASLSLRRAELGGLAEALTRASAEASTAPEPPARTRPPSPRESRENERFAVEHPRFEATDDIPF